MRLIVKLAALAIAAAVLALTLVAGEGGTQDASPIFGVRLPESSS
jgi:hypothetical protein